MGDLVTIARCYEQSEAMVICSLLDQHGIHCVPIGAQHLTAAPHLMIAMQGIQLRVAAEDAEDALALLAAGTQGETYENCPHCGSARQFRRPGLLNMLLCLVLGVVGAAATMAMYRRTRHRYCYDCQVWWQAESADRDGGVPPKLG